MREFNYKFNGYEDIKDDVNETLEQLEDILDTTFNLRSIALIDARSLSYGVYYNDIAKFINNSDYVTNFLTNKKNRKNRYIQHIYQELLSLIKNSINMSIQSLMIAIRKFNASFKKNKGVYAAVLYNDYDFAQGTLKENVTIDYY